MSSSLCLSPPHLQHSSSTDSTSSTGSTELLTPPLEAQLVHPSRDTKGVLQADPVESPGDVNVLPGSKSSNGMSGEEISPPLFSKTSHSHSPSLGARLPSMPNQEPSDLFAGFSFGSCSSVPLASTPIAELGPFEYPDDLPGSSRSSISYATSLSRRGSVARPWSPSIAPQLGRRGSIPFERVDVRYPSHVQEGAGQRRHSVVSSDQPRHPSPAPTAPAPRQPRKLSPERQFEKYRLDVRRGSLPTFSPVLSPSKAQPLHLTLRSSVDGGRPTLRHSISFKLSSLSLDPHAQVLSPRTDAKSGPPVLSPFDESKTQGTGHRKTSRGPLHFSISSRTTPPIPPSLLARREKLGTRGEAREA